jgi:hypothetical protein
VLTPVAAMAKAAVAAATVAVESVAANAAVNALNGVAVVSVLSAVNGRSAPNGPTAPAPKAAAPRHRLLQPQVQARRQRKVSATLVAAHARATAAPSGVNVLQSVALNVASVPSVVSEPNVVNAANALNPKAHARRVAPSRPSSVRPHRRPFRSTRHPSPCALS